jgi:hypothetical protein
MRVKELTKDSIFVKKIGDAYLVDEHEVDGVRTIRTTKNPLKAQHYTLSNVYQMVYNSLDEYEEHEVIRAHEKKDSYSLLTRKVNNNYMVLNTDSLEYGYEDDVIAEAKLLVSIGMEHILTPIKTITQSIDTIEENKEA